jgi:hypothetical protein
MNAEARGRRAVLADHARWLRDESLPRRTDEYTRNKVAQELAAVRWALRVIDAAPDLADQLAHRGHPAVNEEDR